jgi:predicted acetyltransferase
VALLPEVARARLTVPHARLRRSFLRALEEHHAAGEYLEVETRWLSRPVEFAHYIEALRDDARNGGELWRYLKQLTGTAPWLPPMSGWTPQTALWWVAADEYLGRLNIRHWLTEDLVRRGGHIGYDVRPAARGCGHATAMLAAALPIAARMGIDPAHIDCDVGNGASRRVIEKNGGCFEREEDGSLYFLVPTRPGG